MLTCMHTCARSHTQASQKRTVTSHTHALTHTHTLVDDDNWQSPPTLTVTLATAGCIQWEELAQ